MHLRERRHFYGIIRDKGRLNVSTFTEFAENLIDKFALTHRLVDFKVQLLTHFTNLFFAHAVKVVACLFLNRIKDRKAAVGSLKADGLTVNYGFRTTIYRHANLFKELLSESHHPVVVLILNVEFHTSKFRIVCAVHTFVTEVLTNLKHALKSAYDQALQVKFRSNTAIEVDVKRIVVRDKGTRTRTSRNALQNWRFHFRITRSVELITESLHHDRAFHERVFHTFVHH